MNRGKWIGGVVLLLAVIAVIFWIRTKENITPAIETPLTPSISQTPVRPKVLTASESLLAGYGDPNTPPIEDLRKVHRVVSGYFSVIKEPTRFPIGGNADLAAALKGENPNREVFLTADHPIFSKDGLLIDRWGTPLVVHPEGWRQIELRTAGPDKKPYTEDDLVILPTGMQPSKY